MMRKLFIFAALLMASPSQAEPPVVAQAAGSASPGAKSAGPALRRSNRMEFDARLVKGERASGAVYLFHRVSRRLPPLLKLQRDELDRIVMPVLRRPADDPNAVVNDALPKGDIKSAKKAVKKKKTLAEQAAEREESAGKKKKKKKKKKKRKKRRKKKKKKKGGDR